ncbi:pilus assembly protein TadG-related protein [Polymorphum gilvum]|uniref:VWFA domain-containing protein n=1 Tax=Polymorphum gilvum (strain LMG 25793 / CGMCC 1.9160 / SL003B-26A1) TaxID=991905 RepID=F2IZA4_POLGS|nr:pilus assembly protein TadG-related protein [Polymorphum gilvum]ADZ68527.1 hypothetical protein SL003B_0088 [Polymorphum gilvum SL003B-26A1]
MLPLVLRRLPARLAAFGRDARASILPMVGVLVALMVVIGGAGLDYGRAIMLRASISHALDAAVLAVARQLSVSIMTDSELDKAIKDAFAANMASAGLSGATLGDLTYVLDPDAGTISATATALVPTYFIHVGGLGPENVAIAASADATYSRFDVELAMVVDVTGSMRNSMASLRTAAQSVVDILIPDGTKKSASKVRIALVPYSQGVNLGEYAPKVSNGDAGTQNCVTERMGNEKYTDATYNYNGTSSEFFGGGSNSCASTPQMEPLTSKRNTLTSAISKLKDNGRTAGQTGIAWGWYALSPKWSNLWPNDSVPGSYTDSDILKFALIMTDGDFNEYYDKATAQSNCKWQFNWSTFKWEQVCDSSYVWTAYSEAAGYSNVSSTRAKTLCAAIKQTGIQVYSIYFGSNANSAGAKVMKDCASSTKETFFMATSDSELIAAFAKIANKIQNIYLSK